MISWSHGLSELVRSIIVTLIDPSQRMVNGRLEAADMLDWLQVNVSWARFEVLAERSKNLRIEHLEAADAVYQSFQWDALDNLILVVHPLHPQYMVTKVQPFKSTTRYLFHVFKYFFKQNNYKDGRDKRMCTLRGSQLLNWVYEDLNLQNQSWIPAQIHGFWFTDFGPDSQIHGFWFADSGTDSRILIHGFWPRFTDSRIHESKYGRVYEDS